MTPVDPFAPIPLFSWPIFASVVGGHEAHRQPLLDEIAAHRARGDGLRRSNRSGAWHSDESFLASRHPSIGWVLQTVTGYARRALAPLYQDWARHELKLGSYWANVLPKGAWNAPHHHHPQHWSGAYYVSVPPTGTGADDPSGMIEFLNPSPVQSQWGQGSFAYAPRDGTVMLFPSSLVHLVHPHSADADRVSIAFNLDAVPRPR